MVLYNCTQGIVWTHCHTIHWNLIALFKTEDHHTKTLLIMHSILHVHTKYGSYSYVLWREVSPCRWGHVTWECSWQPGLCAQMTCQPGSSSLQPRFDRTWATAETDHPAVPMTNLCMFSFWRVERETREVNLAQNTTENVSRFKRLFIIYHGNKILHKFRDRFNLLIILKYKLHRNWSFPLTVYCTNSSEDSKILTLFSALPDGS